MQCCSVGPFLGNSPPPEGLSPWVTSPCLLPRFHFINNTRNFSKTANAPSVPYTWNTNTASYCVYCSGTTRTHPRGKVASDRKHWKDQCLGASQTSTGPVRPRTQQTASQTTRGSQQTASQTTTGSQQTASQTTRGPVQPRTQQTASAHRPTQEKGFCSKPLPPHAKGKSVSSSHQSPPPSSSSGSYKQLTSRRCNSTTRRTHQAPPWGQSPVIPGGLAAYRGQCSRESQHLPPKQNKENLTTSIYKNSPRLTVQQPASLTAQQTFRPLTARNTHLQCNPQS